MHYYYSVVVGNMPKDTDLNHTLSCVHEINFWKLTSRRVIPDFRDPTLKAVILTYNDEESARLCYLRFKTAFCSFTVYDGIALFQYIKQLDITCDIRSRIVHISGFDSSKCKQYLDRLSVFGTICYFEFCIQGEIPNVKVEFTRATSSFAAVLSLQGKVCKDTIMHLEIPLFPVSPVGFRQHNHLPVSVKLKLQDSVPSKALHMSGEMREQAIMNIHLNDIHAFTNASGVSEENLTEAVSYLPFGMFKNLFGEKVISTRVSQYAYEYSNKNFQEYIRQYFQHTKKKFMSFSNVSDVFGIQHNS